MAMATGDNNCCSDGGGGGISSSVSNWTDELTNDRRIEHCSQDEINQSSLLVLDDDNNNNNNLTRLEGGEAEESSFNPFDSQAESYLHLPFCSPHMFAATAETSTPGRHQRDGSFRWSIDSLAVLKPAEINDDEISRQEMLTEQMSDGSIHERAESAIDKFFSHPIIVPSPWSAPHSAALLSASSSCSSSAVKHVTFSPHPSVNHQQHVPQTATYFNADLSTDRSMESEIGESHQGSRVDTACQTELTLPFDFDLQAVLGPACYSYRDHKATNNDVMSTSNLRRKLFFHEESFSNPPSPVQPIRRQESNNIQLSNSPPLTPYQSSSSSGLKAGHTSDGNTTKSEVSNLRKKFSPIQMNHLDDEEENEFHFNPGSNSADHCVTPTHLISQCTPSSGVRKNHVSATPGMSPVLPQFKTPLSANSGGYINMTQGSPYIHKGDTYTPNPRTPGSLGRIDEGQIGFDKSSEIRYHNRVHHLQAKTETMGSSGVLGTHRHHSDDFNTHFSHSSVNMQQTELPSTISHIARPCYFPEDNYNSSPPIFSRKWTSRISPLAMNDGFPSPGISPIPGRDSGRQYSNKNFQAHTEKLDMYFEDEREVKNGPRGLNFDPDVRSYPGLPPTNPRVMFNEGQCDDNSVGQENQLESTRNAQDMKPADFTDNS